MTGAAEWSDDEIGFIIDTMDWPSERVSETLGRTRGAVIKMRQRVQNGWTPQKSRWADAEDQIICGTPHMRPEQVAEMLPGRSVAAVRSRRKVMSAVKGITFAKNYDPFTVGRRPLLAKTCPECGLLLQAFWFETEESKKGRRWRTRCSRCHHESRNFALSPTKAAEYKAKRERTLERIRANALRSRQPWTEADFKVLADVDLTLTEKALILQRSWDATIKACKRNGFTSKVGLGDPERDQWKIDNPNADAFAA